MPGGTVLPKTRQVSHAFRLDSHSFNEHREQRWKFGKRFHGSRSWYRRYSIGHLHEGMWTKFTEVLIHTL